MISRRGRRRGQVAERGCRPGGRPAPLRSRSVIPSPERRRAGSGRRRWRRSRPPAGSRRRHPRPAGRAPTLLTAAPQAPVSPRAHPASPVLLELLASVAVPPPKLPLRLLPAGEPPDGVGDGRPDSRRLGRNRPQAEHGERGHVRVGRGDRGGVAPVACLVPRGLGGEARTEVAPQALLAEEERTASSALPEPATDRPCAANARPIVFAKSCRWSCPGCDPPSVRWR